MNSLAANRWGDVFVLADNGVGYASLVNKETTYRALPLQEKDRHIMSQMHTIDFNSYGTMLLMWGDNSVGVLRLPRAYTLYGEDDNFENSKDYEFVSIMLPEDCEGEIVKIKWHPHHGEYIVLLHKNGSLKMINVFTKATTTISLSRSVQYSSFTFGPNIGWMAVSVFVLGENGSVFLICPLLPVGSLLPIEVVVQMVDEIAYENNLSDAVAEDRAKIIKLVNLFMSAAFGDLSGEYLAPNNMIRVGGALGLLNADKKPDSIDSENISYHQRLLLEVLHCPPALQGVFAEVGDSFKDSSKFINEGSKRRQYEAGSHKRDVSSPPAVSPGLGSHRTKRKGVNATGARTSACDIVMVPATSSERGDESDWSGSDCAPVVVVISTNGSSKICMIKGQVYLAIHFSFVVINI